MNISEEYGLVGEYASSQEVMFGTECEIESIRRNPDLIGIQMVEDGSLRNNGREFLISPRHRVSALERFTKLHEVLEVADEDARFSERTSTHVHVNCQNLTRDQVKNVLMLYVLFEQYFFAMCDSSRQHNIHCVPLTDTFLTRHYNESLNTLISRWHKYTALNLKPLTTLGTIEFRHMQGHDDVMLHGEWLTILERLVLVGKDLVIQEKGLSEHNIDDWFCDLFAGTRVFSMRSSLAFYTNDQVIDLQLSYI